MHEFSCILRWENPRSHTVKPTATINADFLPAITRRRLDYSVARVILTFEQKQGNSYTQVGNIPNKFQVSTAFHYGLYAPVWDR